MHLDEFTPFLGGGTGTHFLNYRLSNIPFNQAPLESIRYKPSVGVVFTEHACDKLLGKQEVVEEVDGDFPTLLGKDFGVTSSHVNILLTGMNKGV
jgi:hypothetical protein